MSKLVQFLDSEVLQRWAAIAVAVLFPLVVLPPRVADAVDRPTVWNWVVVVVVVGCIVVFVREAVTLWRRRFGRGRDTGLGGSGVAVGEVPMADVKCAIASTTNRISAIKALRERHPGLGLKAAVDLVDAALGE